MLSRRRKTDTVAVIGTFRAPLSDTMRFVNYHLNTRVDHLFLFFDDPADPAVRSLADYQDVTCIPCDATIGKRIIPRAHPIPRRSRRPMRTSASNWPGSKDSTGSLILIATS